MISLCKKLVPVLLYSKTRREDAKDPNQAHDEGGTRATRSVYNNDSDVEIMAIVYVPSGSVVQSNVYKSYYEMLRTY